MSRSCFLPVGVVLMLMLAPMARAADVSYKLQAIVKTGDKVGDQQIPTTAQTYFAVGTLNDQGRLFCLAGTIGGRTLMFQYRDGGLTPMLFGGGDYPGGRWPLNLIVWGPGSMNQRGNVAFNASPLGTFLWDAAQQQITTIAAPGMPATAGLTFAQGAESASVINSSDDIAFVHQVKDATGKLLGRALFLRSHDGSMQPVVLPQQALPAGGKANIIYCYSLSDDGRVGFTTTTAVNGPEQLYVWESGSITPIGPQIAGGGQITTGWPVLVNNHDRTVLVPANRTSDGAVGFYRWSGGQLLAVVDPGEAMPGGGTLKDLGNNWTGNVVAANDAGQTVFLARISEAGTTHMGVYLLEPGTREAGGGQLSLVLKEGMKTELGTVTRLNEFAGIGLNSQGQVALPVRIDNGSPLIVLLTPATP